MSFKEMFGMDFFFSVTQSASVTGDTPNLNQETEASLLATVPCRFLASGMLQKGDRPTSGMYSMTWHIGINGCFCSGTGFH